MRHEIFTAVRQVVTTALALSFGTVLAQGASQPAAQASTTLSAARGAEKIPHRLVVAPAAALDDAEFAKGCWVRFYDGKNFRGEELTIIGPLKLPAMALASPWWRRWNSVMVGPQARVTIHGGVASKNRSMTLDPGQRTRDLDSGEVGWHGKIRSTDVECTRR